MWKKKREDNEPSSKVGTPQGVYVRKRNNLSIHTFDLKAYMLSIPKPIFKFFVDLSFQSLIYPDSSLLTLVTCDEL